MRCFWVKSLENEKNVTLALRKSFSEKKRLQLKIAGVSCYKIWADGKLVGFGPYRAAHGKSKILTFSIFAKTVAIEANAYNVKTYWLVREKPFIALELSCGGKTFEACDFEAYRLLDRVQKVQRYSFQRGFAECYHIGVADRYAFYLGEAVSGAFEKACLSPVKGNKLIASCLSHPDLQSVDFGKPVERGGVEIDPARQPWRDRAMTQLDLIGGFEIPEWEEAPTDEASRFVYVKGQSRGKNYLVYGSGKAITGFFRIKLRVKAAAEVWLLFDELDFCEAANKPFSGEAGIHVCFSRNTCANVIKWRFSSAGEFTLDAFEPYTAGYIKFVFTVGTEIESVEMLRYENPDCGGFSAAIENPRTQAIVNAAVETFRQNSVDLLTDCPSRERAGWLSDSYFSAEAEYILTGDNVRERAFLMNYAEHKPLADTPKIVPMCYPADDYEGLYIPNWALWYVLEIEKYANRYGADDVVKASEKNVRGVMNFFETYENEYSLLENLGGWVFVEWSAANDKERTAGVNCATNALYYAALKAASKILNVKKYEKKSERVKKNLLSLAFDGKLFVDNLTRNAAGKLSRTKYYTEVTQYYFFYFGAADKTAYRATYRFLMDELGAKRKAGAYPEICKSNVMYGAYMRMDLLMRENNARELYGECLDYFYPMAARTGTLWENDSPKGSNVHGFASYVLKWILFSLTGFNGENRVKNVDFVRENAVFSLKKGQKTLKITVKKQEKEPIFKEKSREL